MAAFWQGEGQAAHDQGHAELLLEQLQALDEHRRFDRLVELNVIEQVYNLGKTNIVQNAWKTRGHPYIHGWVFDLKTGHIEPQTSMINSDGAMLKICKFHTGVVGH